MKLQFFRVKNYRSFENSGWIEVKDLTTVIGASEAGKSNLLTALWKLNPASRAGRVKPEQDLPRSMYDAMIQADQKPDFVEAIFGQDEESREIVREVFPSGVYADKIYVARNLDGTLKIALDGNYDPAQVEALTPALAPKLPKTIYSANYGNLDSNVYLPSILRRFNRFGYNAASRSLSRSLRIILSYLGISSTRLLKEIRQIREDKTIKKIFAADIKAAIDRSPDYYQPLIREGCKKMAAEFNTYWRQSTIDIDLEFTETELKFWIINESGLKIELQSCSVGLQWLLSFFLIFTVELKNLYANCILLFDECGMAINPEMQKDLVKFLKFMSETDQIILSTPNPYMLSALDLDNVRVVYRDLANQSVVSNTLDLNSDKSNALSLQTVFSSYGLSMSSMLMTACVPIIVAEVSDTYYLDIIKGYLLAGGWIYNAKEVVFVPTGFSGMEKSAKLLTSQYNTAPYVILPSTPAGLKAKQELLNGYYANDSYRVITMDSIVGKDKELEQLMPFKWIQVSAMDYIRSITGPDFQADKKRSLIQQIEDYARAKGLILPEDYRVQIAQRVKLYEVRSYPKIRMSRMRFRKWRKLFKFLQK